MNQHDSYEFSVDSSGKSIHIRYEFAAELQLVWDAWTRHELLDQWWAPRPYRTITRSQELRVGGTWLYYMLSPENEKHWCKADYKNIEPLRQISWLDAFCDENGVENAGKPRSLWTILFTESNGITSLNVTVTHENEADIETMISMGFREGFAMAVGNLEALLPFMNSEPGGDTFYHGTKADLQTGTLIAPGYQSNYGSRKEAKYAYFSATTEAAVWGAELAAGEGKARIYRVQPTGPFEDDPNLTDKKFPGNPTKSYRTKAPLQVMGELSGWQGHSREQINAMMEALEKMKVQGIEAIED